MRGEDVYSVLRGIGATHLHHANTITTSCTFLTCGGLLSRGLVEEGGLGQTPQPSDSKDKTYGIWHRVFVDHVDIHQRGKRRNIYGPALFRFDIDLLLNLPEGSDVLATKFNPLYWSDSDQDASRWFRSIDELAAKIKFGNFDKMLVIETASAMVDFPKVPVTIILDDPQRQ